MTIRLQKILLPTDFSNYSAAATKYACELATKFDSELHLLHTLETHLASTPNFGFGLDLPKYVSESKRRRKSPWPVFSIRNGRKVEGRHGNG